MKGLSLKLLLAAAWLPLALPSAGAAYDAYPVPEVKPALTAYGAIMPYTRYDCNEAGQAVLNGGATLKTSPDWDASNKATSASSQAYVALPVGGSVTWKATTAGDGVTIRYTIKDSHVGGSGNAGGYAEAEGNLAIYVNGTKAGDLPISSYYMYQYFSKGSGSPSQSGGDAQNFCFDERHVQINTMIQPGDNIEVRCTKGEEVGVDFLELEVVPDELDPADDANGRQIFTVTDYGAKPDQPSFDNRDAFVRCFSAASAVGGIMFVPKGTWYMGHNGEGGHGILSLSGRNVKVMGAGMWHTNIQFTGWKQFGGGISGGNPSNCGSSLCDNIEWCHMYINSNLADRQGENAVYKCFMDIWCAGSVFHDVWEQHFECGWWFGDYNNANKKSNVRLTNCRIRDNFADGVNFCRGTSNSAVFNCSIRNTGDDGLACWDDPALGTQNGNTFCYNTIDFVWRAGAIAIYGGKNQHVHNNYIADTFMSSGIHCNDTFSRGSMEDVLIEENVLVRCGTPWECWGRDYAAIDFEGTNTATVKNNYCYDCPAEALRVTGTNSGVTIDGLYISGAGLSGCEISYSASPHTSGVGNIQGSCNLSNIVIEEGTVHEPTVGEQFFNGQWPWYGGDAAKGALSATTTIDEDSADWCSYLPDYPTPEGIEIPVNIFDTLTGYDVKLTGLDWNTQNGKPDMYDGDKVTFKVRLDLTGNAIPAEGAKFDVTINVDGTQTFTYTVKDGLSGSKIIEFPTSWTATKGEHTFTATVDTKGRFKHESDRTNNSRTKDVNVKDIPEGEEPEIEIVPSGEAYDMGVLKVYFEKADGSSMDEVNVGDELIPHAIVANYGTNTITLGSGQGVLWALGSGSPEYQTGMLWDDSSHTLAPGEWIDVTPNGGGSATGSTGFNSAMNYVVVAGDVTLTCRMDSPTKYNDGNSANNMLSASYTFPKALPTYNENPDKADDLNNPGKFRDYEDDGGDTPVQPDLKYDVRLGGLDWNTQAGKPDMYDGDKVTFKVRLDHSGDAIPEGTSFNVVVKVDGSQVGTLTVKEGLSGSRILTIPATWTATKGEHTFTATVDPTNRLKGDTDRTNNDRSKEINVKTTGDEPGEPDIEVTPVRDGIDLAIVKVYFTNEDGSALTEVSAGDRLIPHAIVGNFGRTAGRLGSGKGILWGLGAGSPEYSTGMRWNDKDNTVNPGEWIDVTPNNGGGANGLGGWNADNTYTVANGAVTLTCRLDNPENHPDTYAANNTLSATYTFPMSLPTYNENPDPADDLDNPGKFRPYEDGDDEPEQPVTGFNLVPTHIFWNPGTPSVTAGTVLSSFAVRVANNSTVDLPSGKNIRVTVTVDGQTVGTATTTEAIMAGYYTDITVDGTYTAEAGGHVVKAVVAAVTGESDRTDNSRERTFNATGSATTTEPAHYAVNSNPGNTPFVIDRVEWYKVTDSSLRAAGDDPIRPGDRINFRAYVRNTTGTTSPAGIKHGIQFNEVVNGTPQTSDIVWCDAYSGQNAPGVAPGETIVLTANGGNRDGSTATNPVWIAKEGKQTIRAWFNDTHDLNSMNNGAQWDAYFTFDVEVSSTPAQITYHPTPVGDDSNTSTAIDSIFDEEAAATDAVWYNMQGMRLSEAPTAPGIYIHNGRKVVVR